MSAFESRKHLSVGSAFEYCGGHVNERVLFPQFGRKIQSYVECP